MSNLVPPTRRFRIALGTILAFALATLAGIVGLVALVLARAAEAWCLTTFAVRDPAALHRDMTSLAVGLGVVVCMLIARGMWSAPR